MKRLLPFLFLSLTAFGAYAQHSFDSHTLYLAHIKLTDGYDYAAHVDNYMRAQRNAVWQTYRNDEFELEGKRNETIEMMKERVAALDLSEPFSINTNVEFGSYDFDKGAYPIEGPGANSYYSTRRAAHYPYPFATSKVFFNNPEIIQDLGMDKADAKAFLNARKRNGYVNRRLPAVIHFRVVDKGSNPNEFNTEITKVEVYSDRDQNQLLVEF